jgi:penicillin-binding protein 1B
MDRDFRPLPALALGAQEVTPLELAAAYATVASGGRRADPLIIHQVTDLDGVALETRRTVTRQVVSQQAAYLLNDVLRGVMVDGTGASAARLGFRGVAAGKTGTTDDTRDAWFVGYTPDLLALVWVGYDDNARTGLTGASGALPIWVDFMKRAGAAEARTPFPEPEGIVRAVIDPTSGGLAVGTCPTKRIELYSVGSEPDADCELHRPGFWRRMREKLRRKS